MTGHAGSHDVRININEAPYPMVPRIYGGRVITILPESPVPPFSAVIYPGCSPGNALNRLWDDLPVNATVNQQVNMIGGHLIIQYLQAVTFLRLKKPMNPASRWMANLRRNALSWQRWVMCRTWSGKKCLPAPGICNY